MKFPMLQKEIRPFREKNVRLLLFGDIFLFLSFWLIQIDLSWEIYKITKSSLHLGLLGFLINIPMILMLPIGGVLADRYDRRLIILGSLVVWCVPTALLVTYTFFSQIQMPLILFAGIIYGCLFAIIKPPCDALVRDVVARKADIHRVIGVDGAANKIMQFAAAALDSMLRLFGGVLASYSSSLVLAFLAFFSFFRIEPHAESSLSEEDLGALAQFKAGFSHVFTNAPIWSTTFLAAFALGVAIALLFQLPFFAGTILKGNVNNLHYLYFAGGIGGTTGGILLGLLLHSKGILKLTALSLFIMGVSLIVFAFSRQVAMSVIFMFLIDGTMIFTYASANAAIQYIVMDTKRGRVMSIFAMMTIGFIPLFSLFFGVFGHLIGITYTVAGAGLLCILAALLYRLIMPHNQRQIKRILDSFKHDKSEPNDKLL